jgi:hypothetical protein
MHLRVRSLYNNILEKTFPTHYSLDPVYFEVGIKDQGLSHPHPGGQPLLSTEKPLATISALIDARDSLTFEESSEPNQQSCVCGTNDIFTNLLLLSDNSAMEKVSTKLLPLV